jgi:hypothetical protein
VDAVTPPGRRTNGLDALTGCTALDPTGLIYGPRFGPGHGPMDQRILQVKGFGAVSFEVFDSKTNRRAAGEATLVLRPGGKARFNRDAAHFLKEQGVERVVILWDKERRKIGIAPAKPSDSRGYSLGFNTAGNSADIAIRAFSKYVGIDAEQSIRIPLKIVDGVLEGVIPREYLGKRSIKKKPGL